MLGSRALPANVMEEEQASSEGAIDSPTFTGEDLPPD